MALNHGSHCTINNQDALGEKRFQGGKRGHKEPQYMANIKSWGIVTEANRKRVFSTTQSTDSSVQFWCVTKPSLICNNYEE